MIALNDPAMPLAGPLADAHRMFLQQGALSTYVELSTMRTFFLGTVAIAPSQITGINTVGENILTAADAPAVRTVIGAAATSHSHAPADITGSTALGQALMVIADVAAAQAAIEAAPASHTHTYTVPSRTLTDAGTTILLADVGALRRGVVIFSPSAADVDFTIDGIAGFEPGDEVVVINVGAVNSVNFVAGTGATFVGASAAVGPESSARMICVTSAAEVQTWMVT